MLINSLDGSHDYNWIINGKECRNFYIDYPNTLYNYKKYKIDPMISATPDLIKSCEDSSSSSSSSSDEGNLSDSSDTSSDDNDVKLPMSIKHKAMMGKYKPTPTFDARGVYNRITDLNKQRQLLRDNKVAKYKSKQKKY